MGIVEPSDWSSVYLSSVLHFSCIGMKCGEVKPRSLYFCVPWYFEIHRMALPAARVFLGHCHVVPIILYTYKGALFTIFFFGSKYSSEWLQ